MFSSPDPARLGRVSPLARLCAALRAQKLTKAALSAYKGSALESTPNSNTSTRSQHEDMALIRLLAAQMRREPRPESGQMIVNVAQLLATLPHVRTIMQRHVEHAGLQETGLGLLGNLACGPAEQQRALLRAGCVPHAVTCLQNHVQSAGVQHNAYRLLR